ncbi:leucine-rich repeat transmembrane protein FLRT1-like [Anopheles arabiensis]|uniref:Uncharacterized protein n=1 Tax=Anopheles arabiensis TaxID=7173 RepID=A0A182I392_ANOAR|nr:leucine-rich repeat transmembrane protein FLRT1-like [Anopheles arabiensis]
MKCYFQALFIGLFVSSGFGEISSSVVKCTKAKGATCVIKSLLTVDSELPDLSKRTTVRILEGSLSNLTVKLAEKLPVRILWLEGLDIQSVYVAPHFEELRLRNNKLVTLETSASSSSYALKVLDVSKNLLNNATQLAPLHGLEELYLDENRFTELSMAVFEKMPLLRVLSAARNGLVKLAPPTSALVLNDLTTLSLAHNRLASVSMENWQLPSLQTLLLNDNSLAEVDGLDGFERFFDLQKLELAGNRWSCGWLQHALEKVTIRQSLADSDGTLLDKSTDGADCSIEKVHGICCSFTTDADDTDGGNGSDASTAPDATKPVVDAFLPVLNRVREAIVQLDQRHEAVRVAQSELLKKLNDTLQHCVEEYMKFLEEQEDESERAHAQAARVLQKVNKLEGAVKRMDSETETVRMKEQERKRLLHFMVDMKNKLLRQAIETDSLWVQANAEKIDYARRLEVGSEPSAK